MFSMVTAMNGGDHLPSNQQLVSNYDSPGHHPHSGGSNSPSVAHQQNSSHATSTGFSAQLQTSVGKQQSRSGKKKLVTASVFGEDDDDNDDVPKKKKLIPTDAEMPPAPSAKVLHDNSKIFKACFAGELNYFP